MGTISLEKRDNLYWLGRYTERVYTTLNIFNKCFDRMLDSDENAYQNLCCRLDIPNIYRNREDFIQRFLFDESNPDSVITSLNRSYDNGIMLRDEISSETLAYLLMSLDLYKASVHSDVQPMALIPVTDYLLAFWGSLDDYIYDHRCRNIIKVGRYVERLDLYYRCSFSDQDIDLTLHKLKYHLGESGLQYDQGIFDAIFAISENKDLRTEGWHRRCAMKLLGLIAA